MGMGEFQSPDERGIECYIENKYGSHWNIVLEKFQSPDERGIECYSCCGVFHRTLDTGFNPLMSGA